MSSFQLIVLEAHQILCSSWPQTARFLFPHSMLLVFISDTILVLTLSLHFVCVVNLYSIITFSHGLISTLILLTNPIPSLETRFRLNLSPPFSFFSFSFRQLYPNHSKKSSKKLKRIWGKFILKPLWWGKQFKCCEELTNNCKLMKS